MITDPHARSWYVEIIVEPPDRRAVLVVETYLQLDQAEPDFETEKVDALCSNLDMHCRENPYLHSIRLVRAHLDHPEFKITTSPPYLVA
jgi:hypothetical protein